MTWNIEKFRPATGESLIVAEELRRVACSNELADTRLPDFVKLSRLFGKCCLPFREHRVEGFAPRIYEALRKRWEREIIIFENPLYEETSPYFASVDIGNRSQLRMLIDENIFEGGYIVSTVSPLFRWFGNFTDYGFMFTDSVMIGDIFQAPSFTTYRLTSSEFREEADPLLDTEISKLDKLWASD